jgi:probable rRNA maturation factor
MISMPPFSLSHTVKSYPTWPYETMKNDILGKRYTLSLSFVGPTRAQKLNQEYRKKEYTPNVLSFPLDESTGEIVICPLIAVKEAHQYNLSVPGYIAFLYIHGLLHLKGYDHGPEMERLEKRFVRKYDVT